MTLNLACHPYLTQDHITAASHCKRHTSEQGSTGNSRVSCTPVSIRVVRYVVPTVELAAA